MIIGDNHCTKFIEVYKMKLRFLVLGLFLISFAVFSVPVPNGKAKFSEIEKQLKSVRVINNPKESSEILEEMKTAILKQLDDKLKSNPHDLWSLINKGWIFNSEGKYDKAIKIFEKSISIKADPSAYMGLGMAYIRKGDLEKANYYYMKALETKNNNNPYYIDNAMPKQ